MGEVLIELEHVGVAFNAQRSLGGARYWALEDVNLQLRRAEQERDEALQSATEITRKVQDMEEAENQTQLARPV